MKGEAVIQVRRQLPEIQQLLLQRRQGNDVNKLLPCRRNDHQADSLECLQQHFRTGVLGLSAGLAWIQPLERLLACVQLLPHLPCHYRQQPQHHTQQQHQPVDAALVLQEHRRQTQRLALQPRPVVLQSILPAITPDHRRQTYQDLVRRVDALAQVSFGQRDHLFASGYFQAMLPFLLHAGPAGRPGSPGGGRLCPDRPAGCAGWLLPRAAGGRGGGLPGR